MSAGEQAAHARFAAAHAAMRADRSLQFTLPAAEPPTPVPAWWKAIGHFLRWLGEMIATPFRLLFRWLPVLPLARLLLYGLLAVGAAVILWVVIDRLRSGEWRWPRLRRRGGAKAANDGEGIEWVPDAAPARALLAEADRLAAAGRFAEAVHLLLQRSVEEVARRRPRTLRPALTSRDIAALPAIPPPARRFFGTIANTVEASLFAGRGVDGQDWGRCRDAYAAFAVPKAWR